MAKVILKDGTTLETEVYQYQGACLAGQATLYTIREGQSYWLKPVKLFGETIYIEDNDKVRSFLCDNFPEECNTENLEEIVLRLLDRLHRLEN